MAAYQIRGWDRQSWGRDIAKGRAIFGGILLFGLLAMTARNVVDPDLGWHLRTGQWIVETGHVPRVDPFSFSRAGSAWVSHEWLADVLFYELWKAGGAAALMVFSALVTTLGFLLLYLRCPGRPHWAAAVTALGALASAPCWGVRPQMFTFALASLLLFLLERGLEQRTGRGGDRRRLLLLIPPLFLLWVNLHAGFALAIALLLAYGAGLIVEAALGQTPWPQLQPATLSVGLLLLACLALVALNPSGLELYRYPFDTVRSAGMRQYIVEWFSPDFHKWLYRPLLLVWLLWIGALAYSRKRTGLPRARVVVPLLFTGFAALDAVRHIPLFVLVAMPVIAAAFPDAASPASLTRPRTPSRFRPAFSAAVVALLAAFAVVRWVSLARNEESREGKQFPQQAVAFLRAGEYPQRIFAYYDWGGYSIWRLYPQYKVFVDGRADLYGDDLLHQFEIAVQLQNGWRGVLEKWSVGTVLLPPSCALSQALLIDPEWRLAYQDTKAVVFFRKPFRQASGKLEHVSPGQSPVWE